MELDIKNILTIVIVSFVGIWLINKGLTMANLGKYKA